MDRKKIEFLKKATSIIASLALILVMNGSATAASLTSVKDILSGVGSSAPSTVATHTIYVTTATAIATSGSVLVDFDATNQDFSFGSLGTADVSATGGSVTWTDETITNTTTTKTISFPFTGALAASSAITLTIGGTNKITNPSTTGTKNIAITTRNASAADVDTQTAKIAIISGVAVTAEISTTLTFAIAGTSTGASVEGITTDVTSTATSIPFGSLVPGTAKEAAQTLTVSTNANSGYTISVRTNDILYSGSNNIDWYTGTNDTPTAWTAPAGTVSNTNTGFLGYHGGDHALSGGTTTRFVTDDTYAGFSVSAHDEIVYSSAPVTSEATNFVYKIEANSMQPTGNYTGTTATFICTPTY